MLFGKEKDLILKICNGILLLWLIGSLIFCASSLINIVVPTNNYNNYAEYRTVNCTEETTIKENCEDMFANSLIQQKTENRYRYINLYNSLANIAIVSTILTIINNRKPGKK